MAIDWLLFPLVLLVVCVGCGLLVEWIGGVVLPAALVPSVGLALVIAMSASALYYGTTAGLATPIVVLLTVAGYLLAWRRRRAVPALDGWAVGLGIALFAVFAAPVVLGGRPSFLGYFVLNDTAIHFSLIDLLQHHGRDLGSVPRSATSDAVGGYLYTGYPIGVHTGLAATQPLVGRDVAWVFQPYLAFILSLNGLALYQLLGRTVLSRPFRATCAFVAAQAGLVYGYYLEASLKELGTLWALTATVAVVFATLDLRPRIRGVLPLGVVVAAGLAVLNLAVAPWLAPPVAVFAVAFAWQRWHGGWREWVLPLGALIALVVVLSLPVIGKASAFVTVAQAVLTRQADLGNLVQPLEWWQILGIWPQGDFRFQLISHQQVAFALMGIALASAVLGTWWVVRRWRVGPLVYIATSLIALFYLLRTGSPYANAKTMMIASPAVVLAATLGAAALLELGRRIEAWALLAVIAGGVLWTTALGYHDASLGPTSRLMEMKTIAHRFAGKGPAYYNQADEFSIYFLRSLQPQVQSFHPPQVRAGLPLRSFALAKHAFDVNDLDLSYIESFPLLVMGRSPLTSRPPANYRRVFRGRYYDVWQRSGTPTVIGHLPIGVRRGQYVLPTTQAGRKPSCAQILQAGGEASAARARLAYVEREALPVFVPNRGKRPPDWGLVFGDSLLLAPRGPSGSVRGTLTVPAAGHFSVWLQASVDRDFPVYVGGHRVGTAGPRQLGPPDQFLHIGRVTLGPGQASVRIMRPRNDLSPGDGGTQRTLGPLVLQPPSDTQQVRYIDPAGARELCGKRLDWIEIVR